MNVIAIDGDDVIKSLSGDDTIPTGIRSAVFSKEDKMRKDMDTIIQNNEKQGGAGYRATAPASRNRRRTGSLSVGKRQEFAVNAPADPEHGHLPVLTALAVAVKTAIRVSRQQPYRYALAATLMSAGAIAQAQSFPASISVQDLDGSNGFVINGNGGLVASVSDAGDINDDGVDDVIIGASFADPGGQSYVVFGGAEVGSSGSLDISSLDGSSGFTVNTFDRYADFGRSVSSAGDINGDGVDDVIIGADNAETTGVDSGGESYVVFGGAGAVNSGSLDISNLDGANGFVILGIDENDGSGFSVSDAGDVNGDGIDDVIIGAPGANQIGPNSTGESYVVFGGSEVGSGGSLNLSTLDGSNGFLINGVDQIGSSGVSVSGAGDFNGDGIDDVLIGAPFGNPYAISASGQSYIVFGSSDVGSGGSINLSDLDGVNGFAINGIVDFDRTGTSVSDAGDINGDGFDDVIIGAPMADADGVSQAGQSFVVFGGSDVGRSGLLNLSNLDGANGFVINGIIEMDQTGISVSGGGDINGDGLADVIIGTSFFAYGNQRATPPDSYVVFGGNDVGSGGSLNLSTLDGNNGFVVGGINLGSSFAESVSGAGDINSDGVDDIIIADEDASTSYVVFGVRGTPIPPQGPDEGPDNDQFENATYLDSADKALVSELTLTVKGTTVNATAQSNEPAHFQGGFGLPPGPTNSIWYRWTPQSDQVVEIDTAGSEVSTVLVAYTGATLSDLQEIATGIDNEREVSRIRFAVRAGETYHFAVDGYETNSQGFTQFNLRQPEIDAVECTIKGTNGPDNLSGTAGADVICALDGDDVIKSLGGDDIIFAGKGSDIVSAGGGDDVVFGGEGEDTLAGRSGDDVLVGGDGRDRLFGGKGNDNLFGGSGADALYGKSGDDALFGEMDGDRLFGGTGNDYMDGGASKDTCVDRDGDDTLVSC